MSLEIKNKLDEILPLVQKPGKYAGGELNAVYKNLEKVDLRFAFCFPDTYDIGMSHLGMKILYSILNERENFWCERVFAPWLDMEEEMRKVKLPLFAIESKDSISDFDIIGFTLQYELSYTNILNMLDLAGVPLFKDERNGLNNLVVAGGPCACNPEPLADFIDIFMPGEGEEVILELCDCYLDAKKKGLSKQEFLKNACKIKGI
ncbi:MAG: B12-binding domain-containing radical SAM protein, partial [Oscillospiraceae bacterium]